MESRKDDVKMSDSLEHLLREADAGATPAAADAGELAVRVRRRATRRRKVRRGAAVGAAGVAMVTLLAWVGGPRQEKHEAVQLAKQSALSPAEVAAMEAEVKSLRDEAERREQVLAMLLDAERRVRERETGTADLAARVGDVLDVGTEMRLEEGRAASILVQSAERMAQSAGSRESAIEEYRRVVELFPRTDGAEQARRRLREMAI